MNRGRDFFAEVFQRKSSEETRQLYDDWADHYEQDHADMGGYLAPKRCAEALARFVPDKSRPVLDVGCGTGLAGLALSEQGFSSLDGTDISPGMLAKAGERSGLYRSLYLGDLSNPLPVPEGSVDHAVAAGVLSPAHAPASCIAAIIDLLPVRGCFAFSLNDHALADPSYLAAIEELVSQSRVDQVFREHGINVPGTELHATVIVLQNN